MVLAEQLVGDVPADQVTLGASFRPVTVCGLELGVRHEEPVAPYLEGLVDGGEPPVQPDRRHRGLAVHPAANGLLNTGVDVGVQTLTEQTFI